MKYRSGILGILLILFVVNNLQAQTEAFRIIGYVPNWIDVASLTKNFDFRKVTHINYAFQNPDIDGNLSQSNNGLAGLVAKAHSNQVKVLISIGGGSAADGTIKNNYQNLISTSEKRAAFIHKIVAYINLYQLDGLDVDEEGPAINSNYFYFIKQLADSLKPKGLLLTAAVGWGGENIPNASFQYFDFVSLMAYDYTGDWDQNNPGQHSPYWYAQKMISDYKKRGVKKEQLCLGLPFYGYGFYKLAGSYSVNKILSLYPNAANQDQVGDTIYYNGKATIEKKTKLALDEASGVMIWELSQDAVGDNSLLSVANQTVDSLNTSVIPVIHPNDSFRVFPNPSKNYLIIENLNSDNSIKIEIFNLEGCLMKSQVFQSIHRRIRIRIASLKPAGYVCRITASDRVISKVFIKD